MPPTGKLVMSDAAGKPPAICLRALSMRCAKPIVHAREDTRVTGKLSRLSASPTPRAP